MADLSSIGLIEVTSIAQGYLAEDAMLKAARVERLLARTICSGKYLIVVDDRVKRHLHIEIEIRDFSELVVRMLPNRMIFRLIHYDFYIALVLLRIQ